MEQNITKAHCNHCSGETSHFVRAEFLKNGNDGETSWQDRFEVLECCGCENLTVRKQFWFSEWDTIDQNPITGEPFMHPGIEENYYPPAVWRREPIWVNSLQDDLLRKLIKETYTALQADSIILATVGTRSILDKAMEIKVGDVGTFENKLDEILSRGFIGRSERDLLSIMIDAGSAAAHRGWTPKRKELEHVLDTVENLIKRWFVLEPISPKLKKAIPPRSKPKKAK